MLKPYYRCKTCDWVGRRAPGNFKPCPKCGGPVRRRSVTLEELESKKPVKLGWETDEKP
jgi:rRNA maturation endonuclease Nob1